MEIPLIDLGAQHRPLQPELDAAWRASLDAGDFIGGAPVRDFEAAFAKTFHHAHVTACGNGTDAIELVLDALGIGPGDEVVVPAMTWFSTGEAVTTRGARAVFADVDPVTRGLSPATVAPHLTPRTRAVIAVHLYGHPCDAAGLRARCDERGLYLVEDCAQAHGARIGGRPVGNFGHAATYSFFPTKNLGALGDGGAVACADAALAEAVRLRAHHGQARRHRHVLCGRNSRLDALQARVLSLKLPHLERWVAERNALAARYTAALAEVPGLTLPAHPADPRDRHAWHLYVVRAERRDRLRAALAAADVATAVHYPTPLHLQPAYAEGAAPPSLPVSEAIGRTALSLPFYPGLPEAHLARVVAAVKSFAA